MKKIILLTILLMSTICLADDTWYVDPDANGLGNGTSYTNAYTSLNAALQAKEENLATAQKKVTFKCRSLNGTADTTAAAVDSTWAGTSSYYVTIECEDSEATGRHSGIWSTSCYRLVPADNSLIIGTPYTVIDGLQIDESNSGSRDRCSVKSANCTIKNTIFKDTSAGAGDFGISTAYAGDNCTIYNCVFYDMPIAIFDSTASANSVVYNCTFHNCSTAFGCTTNSDLWTVKNCIFDGCAADSDGEFADPNASDYNSTTNASLGWTSNTNDLVSQTHPFNDPDNGDFSLTSAVAGETDPSSGLFSTDIAGITRGNYNLVWDRGAWEFITGSAPVTVRKPRIININMN